MNDDRTTEMRPVDRRPAVGSGEHEARARSVGKTIANVIHTCGGGDPDRIVVRFTDRSALELTGTDSGRIALRYIEKGA